MTRQERFFKRSFDIIIALMAFTIFLPLMVVGFLIAMGSTKTSGIYASYRIGQYGIPFKIYKIRTMQVDTNDLNTVTAIDNPRITSAGRWLRRYKMDELPQLWNILKGDMSLVGPRPDVPGFADKLTGEDRIILSIRPGITGLATLAFRNEDMLLANQKHPETYNKEVIWPEKIRLNIYYIKNYSFILDIKIIIRTLIEGNIST